MNKNLYTNESVWSLSLFYPDLQEDLERKKRRKYSAAIHIVVFFQPFYPGDVIGGY